MKFLKAFLYCLLWFILAFLVIFIVKYKEENSYKELEVVKMKVETWSITNNNLPKFEAFSLSIPGYSDDQMYNCDANSNIVIKASVLNPTIENGVFSKLLFYYYNVDDPTRILEYKETLVSKPYVYFVIPERWLEYKFWVKLYDNNGWIIDSEELLSSNPSLYLPTCFDDPDVPTVTLRLSATDIDVWDSVRYAVISRFWLDEWDLGKNLQIYYDFTWDWRWDLITWNNIVDYTFEEPYPFWIIPRVGVEYRWKVWIWDGAKIYVGKYDYLHDESNVEKATLNKEDINEYEIMKMEILAIIENDTIKWNISESFLRFEESASSEEKAAILERIFEVVTRDGGLDMYDKLVVQNEFCYIVEYYNLSNYTEICKLSQDHHSEIYRG